MKNSHKKPNTTGYNRTRLIIAISTMIIFALMVQSSIAQDHRNHHDQNHEAERQEQFNDVLEELVIAVKKFGIDGVLYHQYCPMAIDSEGAT